MAKKIEEVLVPDIGGADDVDVIEILVKPGDKIAQEDSLVTLEGDKATMEIPSPFAGVIKSVAVKVGDKVSENTKILTLEVGDDEVESISVATETDPETTAAKLPAASESSVSHPVTLEPVAVPDIGDAGEVDVIEVAVEVGQTVAVDDPLITLEGDKATMDVPSPLAGEVSEIKVKVGDKVSTGTPILLLKTQAAGAESAKAEPAATSAPAVAEPTAPSAKTPAPAVATAPRDKADVHAGPGVRRIAHEFGIDLAQIHGSGPKQRILKEDVQQFVKSRLQAGAASQAGLSIAQAPAIDFSKFGPVETTPLSKIKKISGSNLHRNWVSVPHVTQLDDADITEMEAFRQQEKAAAQKQGIRLTPLVFIMKAVVAALKAYPQFNASLSPDGAHLIMKKYYHIGVAVDTPNGLVVPVIRDVDQKGLLELAKELGDISQKAREKGLSMADMQGGCFSISSLGGIGGTAFTPIVNSPEVAILGVSKASMKPVYHKKSGEFMPRLMLPLCLSYDHRVIDGADGARFIVYLSQCLSDIRHLLL